MYKDKSVEVVCPYCDCQAELVDGRALYPTRPELRSKRFWDCPFCHARVGCHKGTNIPLGSLADAELRKIRMEAHNSFDPLWRTNLIGGRNKAYQWLADQLGIKKEDCHIGGFDIATCKKVIAVCTDLGRWAKI